MSTKNDTLSAEHLAAEFAGKCIVVTGAGSGIGRETALAFAKQGAQLALLDVSLAGLDETMGSIRGDNHLSVECDISRPTEIFRAFSQINSHFGRIDVLVNNAGINPSVSSSLQVDEAYFDKVMDVNIKGLFFCAQAALRSMISQGSGSIVNLGSISGMIGWGGSAVYSASKGAVLALTKALAIEFAPFSVRVNAVAPGSVRTPMVQTNIDLGDNPENAWELIAATHPLGRPGESTDIAEAIKFLASERSSFTTGSILTIDGGFTAQ